MGCTSSASHAPDVLSEHTNENKSKNTSPTSNKSKNSKNDVEGDIFNVLPTCDNFDETIQLARNRSTDHMTNNEEQNDNHHSMHEHENNVPDIDVQDTKEKETEHKLSTLQSVVDHVILDNILEDIQNMTANYQKMADEDENGMENVTVDEKNESKEESRDPEVESKDDSKELNENIEEMEDAEESVSPSQSDTSRATRWEALADIAAELPATLAVDPVTGQIYSLAK